MKSQFILSSFLMILASKIALVSPISFISKLDPRNNLILEIKSMHICQSLVYHLHIYNDTFSLNIIRRKPIKIIYFPLKMGLYSLK